MRQDAAKTKLRRRDKLPRLFSFRSQAQKGKSEQEDIDWQELAFLLQIDLVLGREKDFVRRLKRAIALGQS